MAWLAFFQANPGVLSGLPLITAVMFFQHARIPKRNFFNSVMGLAIVALVVVAQSVFRNDSAVITAMVSDQALREVITKGTYSMDNGVSWMSFIRMIVFAAVTIMFTVSLNRMENQERYIANLINLGLASSFVVFVLANTMGAGEFKTDLCLHLIEHGQLSHKRRVWLPDLRFLS